MTDSASPAPAADAARLWVIAGCVLAAVAVVGSLALTWVLGLKPCPLCFYQRTFAMGLLAVFALGTSRMPSTSSA